MIETSRPDLLHIYLPTGEVDVLEGCTSVSHVDGLLRFTDKKEMVTITNLPFMMFFNNKEKTDARPDAGSRDDVNLTPSGDRGYRGGGL